MSSRSAHLCALKKISNSLALLTLFFGAATPGAWSQQSAKAAVVERPASPSDPAAGSETAAAVLDKIAHSGLPERGAHDAKVTIVFFDDMQCPYSAAMYQTLFGDVLKLYSDKVKIVIRPLANSSIHPWAKHAAINASCLAAQNHDAYWEFADYVHKHQDVFGQDANTTLDNLANHIAAKRGLVPASLQECLKTQSDPVVKESFGYANRLRVTASPTLFVNGEKLESALPASLVGQAIDRALPPDSKKTQESVPPVSSTQHTNSPITSTNLKERNK